jgi:hypothetical protein
MRSRAILRQPLSIASVLRNAFCMSVKLKYLSPVGLNSLYMEPEC